MNNVNLIGGLATEIELREVAGGLTVGKTLIAVPRFGKKEGRDYIRVVLWNKNAVNSARFLHKGSRVGIVGALRSEFYERAGAAGATETRLNTEVVVEEIAFLSPPPSGSGPSTDGKGGKR